MAKLNFSLDKLDTILNDAKENNTYFYFDDNKDYYTIDPDDTKRYTCVMDIEIPDDAPNNINDFTFDFAEEDDDCITFSLSYPDKKIYISVGGYGFTYIDDTVKHICFENVNDKRVVRVFVNLTLRASW